MPIDLEKRSSQYVDKGLIIDAEAVANNGVSYSEWLTSAYWVRRIALLAQSDKQYDLLYQVQDSSGITSDAISIAATQTALTIAEKQIETATVVGTITTAGDAEVIVTASGMDNSPKTIAVPVDAGALQVETATVIGEAATADGTLFVTVTSALLTDPITVEAAILEDDTDAEIAAKIVTAIETESDITDAFTVTSSDADVILTAKVKAANDATLNIAIYNGTGSGITSAYTSADTTAGDVADVKEVIAEKIRAALAADEDVSGFFDVSGATDKIVLTAKAATTNDATMNIAIDNDTCAGITAAASSANTQAGVSATDTWRAHMLTVAPGYGIRFSTKNTSGSAALHSRLYAQFMD